MRALKIIFILVALSFYLSAKLLAQSSDQIWSKNVSLLKKDNFGRGAASDVWGWRNTQTGKDYALLTLKGGLSVVETTNPSSPTEVAHINDTNYPTTNLSVADVEVYESGGQGYAYLARASTNINPFVLIINVNNAISQGGTILINPDGAFTSVYVGKINNSFSGGQAHTLTIAGGVLYIATQTQYIDIWDLTSNPINPVHRGSYPVPLSSTQADWPQTVHEMFVDPTGNGGSPRAYVAFTRGGIKVININLSTPSQSAIYKDQLYDEDRQYPTLIKSSDGPYDWRTTHSAWPTDDRQYVFTTDELSLSSPDPDLYPPQGPTNGEERDPKRQGAFLRIWKTSELVSGRTGTALKGGYYVPEGVQNGVVTLSGIAGYANSVSNSIHQLFVRGNFAHVAHYTQGFRVLDIASPTAPVEVGYYDDYPQITDANYRTEWFKGVYGVYPDPNRTNIIYAGGSDGFYVFKFYNGTISGNIEANVTLEGTFTVTGNLTVNSGVTLTLNPGTLLAFNSGVSFTVNGALSANGTSNSPVTFSGPNFTLAGSGSINSGYLTLPSGSTMAVASGTTVTFTSGAKFRVNGTLNASYATFQGSGYPGSWLGIEFYNAPSNQQLDYCTIKDASYGSNLINSDVYYYHTTMRDNSYGANCSNYADPSFTSAVFQTNGWGAYGDATSAPYFGAYIGYNSFRWSDYYDIYSNYGGTIYARGNWWGSCPPYPSVTPNVDYSNWLCVDPNPRTQPASDNAEIRLSVASPGASTVPASLNSSTGAVQSATTDVDAAYRLYLEGKYEEALRAFEAIMATESDGFAGRRALVFIERCLEKLGQSEQILARLNSASAGYSGKSLGRFAEARRTYRYLRMGLYQDAIAQAANIIQFNDDTTLVKFALYDLGSIYWYYLADTKAAEQYYRQLIARFPKDHLSNSALATLGEWKPPKPSAQTTENPSLTQSKELPTEYFVSQNYPNPFNPTSVIRYELPVAGHVTLKVYNTLGQEVATLVDGYQDPGVKSVTLDAGRLSSGVYFYRLVTNGAVQVRKMIVAK